MNHIKKFFYLVCIAASTLQANRDIPNENALNHKIKDLEQENEKYLEESAEWQLEKEELSAQLKHCKEKKCPEQKAPIQTVEPAHPQESKKSYLDRAKEKMKSLISNAKTMLNRA